MALVPKKTQKLASGRVKIILCVFLIVSSAVHSTESGTYYSQELNFKAPPPWFTGPLFTPSGHVTPKGHIDIEPYIFARHFTGQYDAHWHSHSVQPTTWSYISRNVLQIGILNGVELRMVPQVFYKTTKGASSVQFGDLLAGFGFQLVTEKAHKWYPSLKFSLFEIFPTGKYQHGNPSKMGTDLVGEGAFNTRLRLSSSKLFYIQGRHYLKARFSVDYSFLTSRPVHGFNSYGGGYGTKGVVHSGNGLTVLSGYEFSLTQNWSLACDLIYRHFNAVRFSGYPGVTAKGGSVLAGVGRPSSEQFGLAPAIEYNWSANLGIIGGVWFSVAGRNTSEFLSGVIALNYFR